MSDHGFTRRTGLLTALGSTLPCYGARAGAAQETASARPSGIAGDGIADDTAAVRAMLDRTGTAYLPIGTYRIGSASAVEYQKPIHLRGDGAGSVIRLIHQRVPAFRVGAVGGEFGTIRAQSMFEQVSFAKQDKVDAPYSYIAIDMASAHSYAIRDISFIGLGPDAVRLTSCYYGYIHGISLANSGITLSDVNNCTISGSDIRPDEFADPGRGAALFGRPGRYPVSLTESDKVTFSGVVIEGWKCPAVLLRRSRNTVFERCWLEGLTSPSHVMRCEDAESVTFADSWIDLSEPYGGSFLDVRSGALGGATLVRIDGGTMIASSRSFGDAGKLVSAPDGAKVRVLIDGLTFCGGALIADRTVDFDIRSVMMSGPARHFLYSTPNAAILNGRNSWMPDSLNHNWDFERIGFDPMSAGLTVTRSVDRGMFLTGSAGIRVAGFAPGARQAVRHDTRGQMGPVVRQGQSYLVFVRFRCDRDVLARFEINGGYVDFAASPDIPVRASAWYDVMFKTQHDVTWAQGRFSPPVITVHVDNRGKDAATLYVDRIDYMICEGDHSV